MPKHIPTQETVGLLISSGSLEREQREDLLAMLPEFHALLDQSLAIGEELAADLLLLYPTFSATQTRAYLDLLQEQSAIVASLGDELDVTDGQRFLKDLQDAFKRGEVVIQRANKVLSHAQDTRNISAMEQRFDSL